MESRRCALCSPCSLLSFSSQRAPLPTSARSPTLSRRIPRRSKSAAPLWRATGALRLWCRTCGWRQTAATTLARSTPPRSKLVVSTPQHALARTNRPPLPAADCGWSTSFSLTWPGPTKVCSILVPGGWRSLTMVPASWTASDCQALAREFRATRVQLGCIFHAPTPPKYAWASRHAGTDAPLPDGALYRPATDCGWASGGAPPAARTIPTKFCSGYVPGAWRTVTVVPPAWQPSDCQAFSRQIGATFYQLGCIFDTPPTGSTEKFVSGPAHAILRPAADAPLLRNCAWRVT